MQGSPHDVIAQGYDSSKTGSAQERCSRCHPPSPSEGFNTLQRVPPSLQGFGPPSLLCFSCHDGTTIVSPEVDASATAFHPRSHGMTPGGIPGGVPADTGLPYADRERLECVTCHDPHNNVHRPFLRAPLGELCLLCHPGLFGTGRGTANLGGNHPQRVNPAQAPVPEAPVQVQPPFKVGFPEPYPNYDGRLSVGTHWDLGGHLAEGATGSVRCETCHAVHGDEAAAPLPDLLARDPVRVTADLFCEGCHRGQRGDNGASPPHPNPGGTVTGRTYHPVDDDLANGAGRILPIREPEGWPFGQKDPRPVLCTSCHRAHGAQPATQILRTPVEGENFCASCHDRMTLAYHHPVRGGTGPCADAAAAAQGRTTWGCEACHRAHNAGLGTGREPDHVPLLRSPINDDQFCYRCHPIDNVTCSRRPERRARHFLGDPTLVDTYENPTPPLREIPWPESGLTSLYAGERRQVVLCLSCHAFRAGAITSGDRGTGRFLVARTGNTIEWGEDEGIYLCTGCHTANPGTGPDDVKGHTHPLMDAEIAKLGREPTAPVTATPTGRVNCDSCHHPHEAANGGGYYILEVIAGPNTDPFAIHPRIDFTPVCHSCHNPGDY